MHLSTLHIPSRPCPDVYGSACQAFQAAQPLAYYYYYYYYYYYSYYVLYYYYHDYHYYCYYYPASVRPSTRHPAGAVQPAAAGLRGGGAAASVLR